MKRIFPIAEHFHEYHTTRKKSQNTEIIPKAMKNIFDGLIKLVALVCTYYIVLYLDIFERKRVK